MANENTIQNDIAQSGNTGRIDDTPRNRALTGIFSVSTLAAVGALLGYCLGIAYKGDKKVSNAPRCLAAMGGVFAGLVALGSQSRKTLDMPEMEVPAEPKRKPFTLISDAAQSAPSNAVNELEMQGKVTPDLIRAKGV